MLKKKISHHFLFLLLVGTFKLFVKIFYQNDSLSVPVYITAHMFKTNHIENEFSKSTLKVIVNYAEGSRNVYFGEDMETNQVHQILVFF